MGLLDMFGKNKKTEAEKAAEKSAALRAQALENARAARERLGDETIQKIANALSEQNKSAGKKAQDQIRAMDKAVVAQHLKSLLDDK